MSEKSEQYSTGSADAGGEFFSVGVPLHAVRPGYEFEGKNIKTLVKDTGVGIPAQEIPNLFDKFHRVQNEKTRQIRGTGLGLWITKQLIEMMKGKILVESIENTGTKVIVVFPLVGPRQN